MHSISWLQFKRVVVLLRNGVLCTWPLSHRANVYLSTFFDGGTCATITTPPRSSAAGVVTAGLHDACPERAPPEGLTSPNNRSLNWRG